MFTRVYTHLAPTIGCFLHLYQVPTVHQILHLLLTFISGKNINKFLPSWKLKVCVSIEVDEYSKVDGSKGCQECWE